VNDRPDHLHAKVLEVDVLSFERQHLFGPEAGRLCHHDLRPAGLPQQLKELVKLVSTIGFLRRLLIPLTSTNSIGSRCHSTMSNSLAFSNKRRMMALTWPLVLGAGVHILQPFLYLHRLDPRDVGVAHFLRTCLMTLSYETAVE
jgi:hypothetical protein